MSQELFYTSAPKGLKPGSNGFCTVGVTAGMPGPLAERLELLSGYRPIYPAGDPSAIRNPAIHAHWRVSVGGKTSSVLSRVAFAGFDHTRRSNKFAHHIVLNASEQAVGGPAWVMMQPGVMETSWSGEPRVIAAGRAIPRGDDAPAPCAAWEAVTGDAGWAGVLAESFALDQMRPAYILFEPGTELLSLINEAIALLPGSLRWQVTFSTYFTDLPSGLSCAWRCCAIDSPAANEVARANGQLIINLSKRIGEPAPSPFVSRARNSECASALATGEREVSASASILTASPISESRRESTAPDKQRRLLSPDQGAQDPEAWMPPSGTTVVELGDDRAPTRSVGWLVVVAAILGWLFAAIAVIVAVAERRRAPIGAAPSVVPTAATMQSDEHAELAVKLHAAQEEIDRLKREWLSPDARQAMELKTKDVQTALADKETELATASRNASALKSKLEETERKLANVSPADLPASATGNAPTMAALPSDPLTAVYIADLPESEEGKSTDIYVALSEVEDPVEAVSFSNRSEQVALTSKHDDRLSIARTARLTWAITWTRKDDYSRGADKSDVIAEISVDRQRLIWNWRKKVVRPDIDRELRAIGVKLRQANPPSTPIQIQFIAPAKMFWNMTTDSSISPNLPIYQFISAKLSMRIEQSIEPWTIEEVNTSSPAMQLRLKPPGTSEPKFPPPPTVELERDAVKPTLSATLKQIVEERHKRAADAQQQEKEAGATTQSIDSEYRPDLNNDQQTQRAERLKGPRANLARALDNKALALRDVDMVQTLRSFDLTLRLPNDVIVARVRISADLQTGSDGAR